MTDGHRVSGRGGRWRENCLHRVQDLDVWEFQKRKPRRGRSSRGKLSVDRPHAGSRSVAGL